MFSYSFVISAASGEETTWTLEAHRDDVRSARSTQRGLAPSTRGTSSCG